MLGREGDRRLRRDRRHRFGDKGGAVRTASRYGNAVTAIPGLAASLAPRPVSRRRTATDRSGRRLLYGVVVLRRKSPAHAVSANKKPSDLEGFSAKRLKGLEPSTFCMASRRSSQLSYSREAAEYRPARRLRRQGRLLQSIPTM